MLLMFLFFPDVAFIKQYLCLIHAQKQPTRVRCRLRDLVLICKMFIVNILQLLAFSLRAGNEPIFMQRFCPQECKVVGLLYTCVVACAILTKPRKPMPDR